MKGLISLQKGAAGKPPLARYGSVRTVLELGFIVREVYVRLNQGAVRHTPAQLVHATVKRAKRGFVIVT
jgi:hypothetical protein